MREKLEKIWGSLKRKWLWLTVLNWASLGVIYWIAWIFLIQFNLNLFSTFLVISGISLMGALVWYAIFRKIRNRISERFVLFFLDEFARQYDFVTPFILIYLVVFFLIFFTAPITPEFLFVSGGISLVVIGWGISFVSPFSEEISVKEALLSSLDFLKRMLIIGRDGVEKLASFAQSSVTAVSDLSSIYVENHLFQILNPEFKTSYAILLFESTFRSEQKHNQTIAIIDDLITNVQDDNPREFSENLLQMHSNLEIQLNEWTEIREHYMAPEGDEKFVPFWTIILITIGVSFITAFIWTMFYTLYSWWTYLATSLFIFQLLGALIFASCLVIFLLLTVNLIVSVRRRMIYIEAIQAFDFGEMLQNLEKTEPETLEDRVLRMLDQGESKTVEFKMKLPEEIGKVLVAFTNTDGGAILLGVDDEGNVRGVDDITKARDQIQQIADSCNPPVVTIFNNLHLDSKEIIVIEVPESSEDVIHQYKNHQYIRSGATCRHPRPIEVNRILEKRRRRR